MPIFSDPGPKKPPRVKNHTIGNGIQGNYDTVSMMRKLARARSKDPRVRDLALRLTRGLASHSYAAECHAIAEYVQRNVRYVRDIESVEQLHDPLYMISELERGTAQGDCDDMALLIATLLLSIGASPKFRMVRYKDVHGPFNHIYVVCYDRKNAHSRPVRLVMDAIIKDKPIGYEVPHKSGTEVDV